jgi:hypothetical protein
LNIFAWSVICIVYFILYCIIPGKTMIRRKLSRGLMVDRRTKLRKLEDCKYFTNNSHG